MPSKKNNNNGNRHKDETKYTFWRNKEDLKKLEKLRNHLRNSSEQHGFFNTDSELYRILPDLYMNAIKKIAKLNMIIDELTGKLDRMHDLKLSINRIMEIMKEEE